VGETKDEFLGAFLRPIKSDMETAMENWTRPLQHFVFKLKKKGSVDSINGKSGNYYLSQYTEEDFDGFSSSRTGWGFHEFCPLPIPFDELSSDDTISIEVQIVGPMVVKTSTIDYKSVVAVPKEENQPFVTTTFGPPSCLWQLQLSIVKQESLSLQLAAHLCPVHSEFENSMGAEWERTISSFTLKLCNAETNQVLFTKTITGSFHLSQNTQMVGWDDFVDVAQIASHPKLLAVVHVTWDPALISEYTILGKTKSALTTVTNEYQQCFDNMTFYQNENYNLQNMYYEKEQLLEQLKAKVEQGESLRQAQELMSQELIALRERVKLLTLELKESRLDEKSLQMKDIQLATMKERITKVRFEMDNPSNEFDDENPSDMQTTKLELSAVLYQKAQLELQLAQAQSELQFLNRSSKDNLLMAPIPSYEITLPEEEIAPTKKLFDALEVCRNEITVGKTALNEIQSKINENLSQIEKSGLIADISMVQCGLDVASATMHEVCNHCSLMQEPMEFHESQQQLEEIRKSLLKTRLLLEGIDLDSKKYILSPSQGDLGPPPVVARHGGNKRKASTDNFVELDKLEKLDTFTTKMESIVELIKNKLTSTSSVAGLPVSTVVEDFESWTPNESKSSLDVIQLQVLYSY
jgi:hypothetical protein